MKTNRRSIELECKLLLSTYLNQLYRKEEVPREEIEALEKCSQHIINLLVETRLKTMMTRNRSSSTSSSTSSLSESDVKSGEEANAQPIPVTHATLVTESAPDAQSSPLVHLINPFEEHETEDLDYEDESILGVEEQEEGELLERDNNEIDHFEEGEMLEDDNNEIDHFVDEPPEDKPKGILLLGDSNFAPRHFVKPDVLRPEVKVAYFNGASSWHLTRRVKAGQLPIPERVLVYAGTNDILCGHQPPIEVARSLANLKRALIRAGAKEVAFVVPPSGIKGHEGFNNRVLLSQLKCRGLLLIQRSNRTGADRIHAFDTPGIVRWAERRFLWPIFR